MKHFVSWFKKDPLIHGIILLLTIPGVVMVLVIGFLLYGFVTLFDPNYEEFGPNVSLFKTQSCAFDDHPQVQNECQLAMGVGGMWKNNPGTLDTEVESVANQPDWSKQTTWLGTVLETVDYKRLPALNGYPKKGNQWTCSKNSQIIPDNTKERVQAKYPYKCWPR